MRRVRVLSLNSYWPSRILTEPAFNASCPHFLETNVGDIEFERRLRAPSCLVMLLLHDGRDRLTFNAAVVRYRVYISFGLSVQIYIWISI